MSQARGKVLLIHDEPEVAAVLGTVLEDAGLTVHLAGSAAIAIRDLRAVDPDVVVTRNHMPMLGGRHVIRAVASAHMPVPVVVTSIEQDVVLVVELMRLGATDCVLRPLEDPGAFLAAVERALKVGRERRETARLQEDLAKSQADMARMLEAQAVIRERAFERIDEPLDRAVRSLIELRSKGLLDAQRAAVDKVIADLSTVGDVLTGARSDASRTSTRSASLVEFHPLNLVESVRDVVLRPAHRRGVEVAYFVPGELGPLRGDPQGITALLVDLCGFIVGRRTGGVVSVSLTVEGRGPGPWVIRFDVSDSDTTAPVSGEDRIAAYLPGDDVATVREDLIDLSLCVRRVAALGGELALYEQRGEGMRFSFDLAILQAKRKTHALVDPGLNAADVLVAEPVGQLRRCMSNELVKLGMRCATAGSADQALTLLQRAADAGQPHSMVFLSLSLPDRARVDAWVDANGSTRRAYLSKAGEYAPSAPDTLLMMRPPKRQVLIEVLRRAVGVREEAK